MWCTKAIHIRTFFLCRSLGGLAERNSLCTLFIVKSNQHFIVIEVNCIDEGVDQSLPLFLLGQVQLAEAVEPEADEFLLHHGIGQFFFGNLDFEVFFLGLEGFQPLLGGAGQNAGLDGVEHILDAGLGLPELLLVKGQARALPVLQLHDRRDEGIDDCIVLNQFHSFVDYQVFQPLFADRLFGAGLPLFRGRAFIIVMGLARMAHATLPKHQRATTSAKQFRAYLKTQKCQKDKKKTQKGSIIGSKGSDRMTIHRYEVTDAEWDIIEPMLPKHHMGRPQKDLRAHFNGILWIARSGARWEDLPARYGPHQTVYSCFCRWRDDGTLEHIFHKLGANAELKELNIDSTTSKVSEQASRGPRKR